MEARKRAKLRGGEVSGPEEIVSWVGWRVEDPNGTMLGHVESVIGDGDGGVAGLIVAEFRLGDGRRHVVPAFTPLGDRRLRADRVAPERRAA